MPPGWKEPRKVGARGSSRSKGKNVPVTVLSRQGYAADALSAALEEERVYRKVDDAIVEAENRRNDYETLVFELQSRTSSDPLFTEFASPEELAALKGDVQAAEDWIYEHEEEEASVYVERLQHLNKQMQGFSCRKSEAEAILEKVKALKASVRKYKALATAAKFDHIAKEKLSAIVEECDSATQFLSDAEAAQASRKKWEPSTPSLAELTVRMSSLEGNAMKILSEPRPKAEAPPKEAKVEAAAAKDSDGKHEAEESKEAPATPKDAKETLAAAKAAVAKAQKERQAAEARRKKRRLLTIVGVIAVAAAVVGVAWWRGNVGSPSSLAALFRMGRGGDDGDDEALVSPEAAEFDGSEGFVADEM